MSGHRLSGPCLSGLSIVAILFTGPGAHAQTPPTGPSPAAESTPVSALPPVVAQAPQPSPTPSLEKQFLKNLLLDQKAIWTSPFHLRANDARWLVPLSAGTAVFFATDRRTGDAVGRHPNLLTPSHRVSDAGTGYSVGGAALTIYVVGLATHNARARETGLLSVEALIGSSIVVTVIKDVTQRGRPTAGDSRGQFFTAGSSFPSGHSSGIWSLATVVASEYHDHRLVQIAAYGIATAVSLSRITGQNHYPSDVLVGSAIGFGIGRYVYRTHHVDRSGSVDPASSRARSVKWPMIAPQYDRRARAYGVTLGWVF